MRGKRDIFDGIQEQAEEDTERVLKRSVKGKEELKFHIVHRMLKKIQGKHRPIDNTYGEQHRMN